MLELNKIYNMDCLEGMKQIDNDSVDCVIADPPYNIGKDIWDHIPDYCTWFMSVVKEVERVLKDNGTFWYFHMNFCVLAELHNQITKNTSLRHKQLIVIDKGKQSIAGRVSDKLRSYPRATEYLQFYTFNNPTGAEQLSDKYAKINPMAKYLKLEFERAGVTNKEIAKLFPSKTGGMTGCVSNWILGYNFPTKKQYERMRGYLNYEYLRKEYEDLRKEYEDLRKEYEDLRYPFFLQHGFTDVWKVNFYKESTYGHCTCKPIRLMRRVLKTATKEGMVVCDPFCGSGSTLVACRELNRKFIGFELNKNYYNVSLKRLMNVPRKLEEFITCAPKGKVTG